MTLKTAATIAIIGTLLWTIRLAATLIRDLSGVSGGYLPANALLASLIDFAAALSLLVFFIVFRRLQS